MTIRINARLDPELARKVEALAKRTGQSTTDILKASLEAYYVAVSRDAKPAALLADFVGCAAGPRTLSEDYKRELTKSWHRKSRP
jgi:predicted transcriptional regulator